MDYLAVFVIGRKRFGIPRRFDRETTRLANTCDSCKVIASVFACWDFHFCYIASLKTFDPLNSPRLSIRSIVLFPTESILISFADLSLASPHSLNL